MSRAAVELLKEASGSDRHDKSLLCIYTGAMTTKRFSRLKVWESRCQCSQQWLLSSGQRLDWVWFLVAAEPIAMLQRISRWKHVLTLGLEAVCMCSLWRKAAWNQPLLCSFTLTWYLWLDLYGKICAVLKCIIDQDITGLSHFTGLGIAFSFSLAHTTQKCKNIHVHAPTDTVLGNKYRINYYYKLIVKAKKVICIYTKSV